MAKSLESALNTLEKGLKMTAKKRTSKTTAKKPRTAAQKRATAKMLAANRARRKNPEIHIDVNSHNARKSPKAKTNPSKKREYYYEVLENGKPIAGFMFSDHARKFAQDYADTTKAPVHLRVNK